MLKSGSKKNIFIFIAVMALLIFFHSVGVLSPIENMIIGVFDPALNFLYSSGSYFGSDKNEDKNKQELLGILNRVQEENNKLTAENSLLKVIKEENQELRKYLDFLSEKEHFFVLANIISKRGLNMFSFGQEMIIDKGSKDGLRSGLVAVDNQGIVVGKILSVKDSLAEVCLVVNNNCKFAISSQNKNNTLGVSRGDMGITIKMDFIPQTEEINSDDIIITSGLEADVPRGLVLGKVTNVDKESNRVWKSATINSLASFDNLNIVSILLPQQ